MCSHALICLVLLVDGFPLKIYNIYRVFLLIKEFILIHIAVAGEKHSSPVHLQKRV
jgi:hypothetical protein